MSHPAYHGSGVDSDEAEAGLRRLVDRIRCNWPPPGIFGGVQRERIGDLDGVELIARRAERLTREEASCLLSRITRFGPAANRRAVAGLRTVLGGQAQDPAVAGMLDRLHGI
jgi:hypothetical protein